MNKTFGRFTDLSYFSPENVYTMNMSLFYFRKLTLTLLLFGGLLNISQAQNIVNQEILLNESHTFNVQGINLSISNSPEHGVAIKQSVSGGFDVTYTPNSGYSGRDTFTVKYRKLTIGYPWTELTYAIKVAPAHTYAANDYATTLMEVPVTIPVMNNDTTSFGTLELSENVAIVNFGTTTVVGNNIIFTPAAGFSGMAHINYTVCNELNACDIGTVSINVFETPLPPNDTTRIITAKNTPITFILPDGFNTGIPTPQHGTVGNLAGSLVAYNYQPQTGYVGFDTFIFEQTVNQNGNTYVAKHLVRVHVLDAPTPNTFGMNDWAFTAKAMPVIIDATANDLGLVNIQSNTQPAFGSVTFSNNKFTYTPNADFYNKVDNFTYNVKQQGTNNIETVTVSIAVSNYAPADDTYYLSTLPETEIALQYNIPLEGYTFTVTDAPSGGTIAAYSGNSSVLAYTPSAGTSADVFELEYCMNGDCKTIKIYINISDASPLDNPYCNSDCVWPGDANNDGKVNVRDVLPLGYSMGEQNLSRYDQQLEWYGHASTDWSDEAPYAMNKKYVDTNGDGIISAQDTAAIGAFYGFTHQITPEVPAYSGNIKLYFNVLTPNPAPGDMVVIDIVAGTQSKPAINAYGLAFDMNYNSSFVQDGSVNATFSPSSWMTQTSPTLGMARVQTPGKLEIGYTRTSGLAASGYGPIGQASFIVIEDIDGSKSDGNPYIEVALGNIALLDGSGVMQSLEGSTLKIPIKKQQEAAPVTEQSLVVYPNPARDVANLYLNGGADIKEICLYNNLGQEMLHQQGVNNRQTQIKTADFPAGLYFIEVLSENGRIVKKLEIVK